MNKLERLYLFLKKFEMNIVLDEVFADDRVQIFIFEAIKDRITTRGLTASLKKLITNIALKNDRKFFDRRYKSLQYYAPLTIRIKKKMSGLSSVTEHVTLFNSGDFYDSFKISTTKNTIKISAEMEKSDGNIHDNFSHSFTEKEFIKEILSLSEAEKKYLLTNIVQPYAVQIIRKSLKSL